MSQEAGAKGWAEECVDGVELGVPDAVRATLKDQLKGVMQVRPLKAGEVTKLATALLEAPEEVEAEGTDQLRLREIKPEDYANAFVRALDDPRIVWDLAFRKHIPPACRHLLYALFFCSEYGVALDDLKKAFNALHPVLCKTFGHTHDAKDFEDAVKILEGGFIAILGRRVSFINPSLRDYFIWFFSDIDLLLHFAEAPQFVDWAAMRGLFLSLVKDGA
jgi:hypothetical protein